MEELLAGLYETANFGAAFSANDITIVLTLCCSSSMAVIYQQRKDDDGFVYMAYSGENSMG